ncbi:universal stress protein [Spongiimicrobium sp. 3-5]|uniref:universal stress protein n=1 Tax=Spongiimicrobium sp. 3-5 TaxID=3332596 RepID=UPI0039801DEE
MKHILVATDFSNNAYSALFYVTSLLKEQQAVFYILNTYTELTPLLSLSIPKQVGRELKEQLKDESMEGLQSTLHKIVLDNGNPLHRFKTISKHGDLVEAIASIVKEGEIDLVVMGTRGITEAKAIFMGSSSLKVIGNLTSCPILMVPQQMDFKIPKEIAFVTDYKRAYQTKELTPLLFISQLFDSFVRVMHINEDDVLSKDQRSCLRILKKHLASLKTSFHWMPYFLSKSRVINNFLEEQHIELLVMVNYKHGFLKHLFKEPVIRKVTFNLAIPFLVIPGND